MCNNNESYNVGKSVIVHSIVISCKSKHQYNMEIAF